MKDRIVQHPNRYKLTPVAGTGDTFDLSPAPGAVTDEGTPLNKATLLSDETAFAIFGSAEEHTVNEALRQLNGAMGEARGAPASLILDQPGFVLTDGALVRLKLHVFSDSHVTLNINDTGAKPIKTIWSDTEVVGGIEPGTWITLIYSEDKDSYIMQSNLAKLATALTTEVITTNSIWTVPTDALSGKVFVRLFGGGGGGGYTPYSSCGGGGGGGGHMRFKSLTLPFGEQVQCTIGAGGAGGTSSTTKGNTGGTTSFGAYLSAPGGSGGANGVYDSSNYNGTGGNGGDGGTGGGGGTGQTGETGEAAGGSGGNASYGGAGGFASRDWGGNHSGGGGGEYVFDDGIHDGSTGGAQGRLAGSPGCGRGGGTSGGGTAGTNTTGMPYDFTGYGSAGRRSSSSSDPYGGGGGYGGNGGMGYGTGGGGGFGAKGGDGTQAGGGGGGYGGSGRNGGGGQHSHGGGGGGGYGTGNYGSGGNGAYTTGGAYPKNGDTGTNGCIVIQYAKLNIVT